MEGQKTFNTALLRREARTAAQKHLIEQDPKLAALKEAHDNVKAVIDQTIQDAIRQKLAEDPEAHYVVIFNPHRGADLNGLHHLTVIRGYFDRETGKYYRTRHRKAGIKSDPLRELELEYRRCMNGITEISDISDSSKSFNFVIKVWFR